MTDLSTLSAALYVRIDDGPGERDALVDLFQRAHRGVGGVETASTGKRLYGPLMDRHVPVDVRGFRRQTAGESAVQAPSLAPAWDTASAGARGARVHIGTASARTVRQPMAIRTPMPASTVPIT